MLGKISIAALWVLVFVQPITTVHGKDHARGLRDELQDQNRKLTVGSIAVLQLINADTNNKILDLTDGAVIYVTEIPGLTKPSFNINASYAGTVRSVVYGYNNTKYRTEVQAPFAFCGNNRDDFFKCEKLGCGTHTVTATPYDGSNGRGAAGSPISATFTIECDPKTEITGLQLINANNDTKVADLVNNGTVVPGTSVPSFNINASYSGPVKSVVYWHNGTKYLTEDVAPFAFCENDEYDFFPCHKLECGENTVTAVPYPSLHGSGQAGKPFTATFVIDCSPAPVCPSCVPSNGCFSTSCVAGQCVYTPTKACPTGESCDPQTGNCRSQNSLRPCVAVIDESVDVATNMINTSYFDNKWAEFRTAYPDRPFCLLQPIRKEFVAYPGAGIYLPPAFLNDTKAKKFNITREDGLQVIPNPPLADWFDLCDIGVYAATGVSFVGLFVDTSGSLQPRAIATMLANFTNALNATGLKYKSLYNNGEDWILPFLTDLSSL